MLGGDIYTLQELLGHEDIATIKNYMHLNDTLVQEQKRKFSPGDNVPFSDNAGGRKVQSDFREPLKRKQGTGRGKKPQIKFIDHALELNGVLISAIRLYSYTPRFSLASFIHERSLKRLPYKATWQGNSFVLIPDAFLDFRLHTDAGQRQLPLLLEHDRETEEQYHFRHRIHAYLQFIQSQAYVRQFNTRPLTVAFTTLKGIKRIKQMREWVRSETASMGIPAATANVFVFGALSKPLEPRTVWLEPCWYTLQDGEPTFLLEM